MPFPAWPKAFRRGDRPRAPFWNKVRREISLALDGSGGGSYGPVAIIEILGAGLRAFFQDVSLFGVLSWGADAQDVMRVARIVQDSGFTIRAGDVKHDIVHVDGSVFTAPQTCTIAVASDAGLLQGEIVIITMDPGGFALAVDSEGGASNPVISFGLGPNTDPEWAACWFDDALGEWRVLAHGQM